MRACIVVAAVLTTACAPPSGAQATAPSALIGTWKLHSLVDTLPDGSVYRWLGFDPIGEIRYDATGHMAVQFMRDPRPTMAGGEVGNATTPELRAIVDGYYAYLGRYELNARGDTVAHFVEASLRPEEVGIVYKRAVRLNADELQISLEFISAADSLRHRRFLTFRRVR
jgi:hypothetical protein